MRRNILTPTQRTQIEHVQLGQVQDSVTQTLEIIGPSCWNINLLNNPNLWTNQETDPGNIKRNTCRKDRSHFVIIHIVFIQGEFSSTGIPHGSSVGSFNARGPAFAGGQDWKSHTPSMQRILEVKISLHMKAWNII